MNKNQKALKNVKAQSKTSATQFDKTALKRLFSYMKEYKRQLVFVIIFILLSAVASAASSVFLPMRSTSERRIWGYLWSS